MYPHVVLVVGGAGEAPSTAGLGAHVRPLACVRADVNLPDVGGGERPATSLKRALKRFLTYNEMEYKRQACMCVNIFQNKYKSHTHNKLKSIVLCPLPESLFNAKRLQIHIDFSPRPTCKSLVINHQAVQT